MKPNTFPRFAFAFVLAISLYFTSLPTAGYAQTAAIGAKTAAAETSSYAAALQRIEEKLDTRRREFGIPGVSLVIVKDDQVIYSKGLGYKDLEKQLPVTADTQFAIGSATKAFTALTVLMAHDQAKLSLDDSPKKYLPYFRMYDAETDKAITIRDLLSHSSGLNRTDLAMITGKLNRAELIEVAAQAKPTAKLREKFQYQNIMFVAAGEVTATVEKTPWDKLVADRIFKPLGMTNSTLSIAQMEKAKDRSFGYNYNFDTKETKRLPYREIVEVAPAGSINSSARDMAEWLRFVLNGGVVNGKRLISEKAFEEWTKPQMKMSPRSSYGLGWFIQEWKGMKVVQHGGNIDGFNSLVAMLPEKKVGFALLTNVSGSPLGDDIMPVIWQSLVEGLEQPKTETPSGSADKEVGRYKFEAAGFDIEVKLQDGKLAMIVPGQPVYTLENVSARKYKLGGAPDGFFITFKDTEAFLEQPHGNYTLPKAGATVERKNSEAAKELIGPYSTPNGSGTVEIKESNGAVTFNIPGQQPYTLMEKAKDSYALSPLPDSFSMRAKRDESGKVISVVVTQPEGEFEFKRKAAESKPSISVDEIMQKYIDAIGGEANLRKVTTRVIESNIDLENQGVKATSISYSKAPNRSATETVMTALNKRIANGWEYFDGTTGEEGFTFAPFEKFTGKRLEDARLASDLYAPLNWRTSYKKVEVTGTAKVGGEEAYVVSFEPEKGTPFKEYYSTTTFLLVKREGVVPSSTSPRQLPYTVTYSDYREVDGIKLPFRMVNNSISNGNIVQVVKSVKHNVPIEDSLFAPRKLQ